MFLTPLADALNALIFALKASAGVGTPVHKIIEYSLIVSLDVITNKRRAASPPF
jgi:hypothetical protein